MDGVEKWNTEKSTNKRERKNARAARAVYLRARAEEKKSSQDCTHWLLYEPLDSGDVYERKEGKAQDETGEIAARCQQVTAKTGVVLTSGPTRHNRLANVCNGISRGGKNPCERDAGRTLVMCTKVRRATG